MQIFVPALAVLGLTACSVSAPASMAPASMAHEDSAEYAANCMAAASLIKPIAEITELADPATLEIYEAVEKYWQGELETRSANASKAADYGLSAIDAIGGELGDPGEPAFRKAQTILQSCEAST